MAHGKRPGTISRILGPSPPPCSSPGLTTESQEEERGLIREASEQPNCSFKEQDDNNDQLTPPASANHYFMSCDPSPEDMEEEDTCSEYDNVGSDVEQDYDEVLRAEREGTVGVRYYNQYGPEDGGYVKHTADGTDEGGGAVDQFTPRSPHGTEMSEGSQPDAERNKTDQRFSSHRTATAGGEAEGEAEEVQEHGYFLGDTDEIEEVLDGAKFIEDLEETEDGVQQQTSLYQGNEGDRIRKAGDDRVREDGARITRNNDTPGAGKKLGCESSHRGPKEKERQGKGRGRRATGEDSEHIASEAKGCMSSSAEPRPKMLSKDCKKAAVRTKARSSSNKAHPPPPPRHTHTQQAHSQQAQRRRETPPVPRPSPSAHSQESHPRVIKPSLAPHHTPEQQKEPLEERQRRPEKPQQVTDQGEKPSTTVMPEDLPEQPSQPQCPEPVPTEENSSDNTPKETASFPSFVDVPGPCEPEDLIDGIIFAANYLGCTQVLSDKNPSKSIRMSQAQEAVNRIKSQDEDSQMMTEVDLFISTKAVKVLNADTQETMMDSALRTISYIADIGSIVVLMARRRMSQATSQDCTETPVSTSEGKSQYRMICYVFESEDAQLIAQSIGQAFSVAYREFLRANGINPTDLSQKQYSDIINSQEMYNDDLVHFSNSDNCKELYVEKQKGESLGVVIVESGWGSILPTVILANMLNSGPAARSGKLSVGDQIMSINDTSLVGLPLATCQGIIKGLKNQVKVKLSIVSCPPVTTVLIKRPDLKFQLGFSVQNGIICSLMRGGIAERGGVRVGHRIIEINGQSVVAMAHEKIVQTLSVSVGEINMKTMPAVMFRLLTGQETPIYI
ncbi:amyloid-beta A4 precursor protein-binding family A member 2-like isoform X2 [Centroberyx affinis]|uniref:amyloid-beta A4 precursor protein-binding family A member 2-like isoform X2 n=1 Tax=Centroberyx affinis TaxID=166261 RepID=UPI003A5C7307